MKKQYINPTFNMVRFDMTDKLTADPTAVYSDVLDYGEEVEEW